MIYVGYELYVYVDWESIKFFIGSGFFVISRKSAILYFFISIELLLWLYFQLDALHFKSNYIFILELNELMLNWLIGIKLFHLFCLLTLFPRTNHTSLYGCIFSKFLGFRLGPFLEKLLYSLHPVCPRLILRFLLDGNLMFDFQLCSISFLCFVLDLVLFLTSLFPPGIVFPSLSWQKPRFVDFCWCTLALGFNKFNFCASTVTSSLLLLGIVFPVCTVLLSIASTDSVSFVLSYLPAIILWLASSICWPEASPVCSLLAVWLSFSTSSRSQASSYFPSSLSLYSLSLSGEWSLVISYLWPISLVPF